MILRMGGPLTDWLATWAIPRNALVLLLSLPAACATTPRTLGDRRSADVESIGGAYETGTDAPAKVSPDRPAHGLPSASDAAPRRGNFVPGVRIDWDARVVEVDGEVVLRKGPLELFACSRRTREHESIVVIHAQPMHVFQAMGLIGMAPGSPVRFDEAGEQWLPPTGERLQLSVRYAEAETVRLEPLENWLSGVETKRTPPSLPWVFAGSRTFEDGEFAADDEGTVICVVDFDTALITVGALHSADNEELWLEANTEEIPPLGTPVTLLIQSLGPTRQQVELTSTGQFRRDGVAVTLENVAQLAFPKDSQGVAVGIIIHPMSDASEDVVEAALERLVEAGVSRESIKINRDRATSEAP